MSLIQLSSKFPCQHFPASRHIREVPNTKHTWVWFNSCSFNGEKGCHKDQPTGNIQSPALVHVHKVHEGVLQREMGDAQMVTPGLNSEAFSRKLMSNLVRMFNARVVVFLTNMKHLL